MFPSPVPGPKSEVVDTPAAQALAPTALNPRAVAPAGLTEFLALIATWKAGISLYRNVIGSHSGGSTADQLHDLFRLLAKAETDATRSGDVKNTSKEFTSAAKEKQLIDTWMSYLGWQKAKDKKAEDEKKRQERLRAAIKASQAAKEICDKHPAGPSPANKIGTVVAGLAHVEDGRIWTGTSGVPNHAVVGHPVMTTLLKGTHRVQEWPVEACAEVDVMKQYLKEYNVQDIESIDGDNLYFHAIGWNANNPNDPRKGGKWKAWAACGNCSQWFEKTTVNRI